MLAFTLAVSLVTGVLFGLIPALAASNPDLNETLKEGGRGGTGGAKRKRIRSAFVIAEITLALVLLIGAGLMLKSFRRLQSVDAGFNPDGVLTMRMMLPFETYETPGQREAFYKQLLEHIRSAPGVAIASATSAIPLARGGSSGTISGENSAVAPGDLPVEAEWRWVIPDYFRAIGSQLIAGRDFTDADSGGAPLVAVVDQTFAARYYPNEDAVGKRIKRGKMDSTRPWMTIVGVVRHVQSRRLDSTSGVQVYFPFYQDPNSYNMSLVVHTSTPDPLSLTGTVRSVIQSLDNTQPVYDVYSLRQIVADSLAQRRFSMLLNGFVCGARAGSCSGGNLRSDVLCGCAADPRDRYSYGPRRSRWRHLEAGDRSGSDAHLDRRGIRSDRRPHPDPFARDNAVRHQRD